MPTIEEEAILRAVAYASVFEYPLTLAQLQQGLSKSRQSAPEVLWRYRTSDWLRAVIEHRDGLFFLRGRDDLIAERERREARTEAFLARHRRVLRWLVALPFVELVALSGSVAHRNLAEGGDLDLFVVTRGAHVWSVTVTMLLVARALRCRDTLCVNFVIADDRLRLEEVDEFTASQMVALKPLVGTDVFKKLVAANPLVEEWYPNFRADLPDEVTVPMLARQVKRMCESRWLSAPARAYEWFCRVAYRTHLRRRAPKWSSPEQVQLRSDYLKLHTHSHRRRVKDAFDVVLNRVTACGPAPLASVGRGGSAVDPARSDDTVVDVARTRADRLPTEVLLEPCADLRP